MEFYLMNLALNQPPRTCSSFDQHPKASDVAGTCRQVREIFKKCKTNATGAIKEHALERNSRYSNFRMCGDDRVDTTNVKGRHLE
jgi:hypothetical protein